MQSYFEFVMTHKSQLEQGNYGPVRARPTLTFKEPITEQIVALNAPDLSKD